MNVSLLNTEIQAFINSNINADISSLVLKGSPFPNVTIQELIAQIEAKKRCEKKLPTWFNTPNIYYPNKLNIEQTSSEITAKFKANLLNGNSIIDLTGGFGVDCFYFSKVFKTVIHCEINTALSTIVKHNFKQLPANVETVTANGIEHLNTIKKPLDWIYIDPSRRHDSKGKVFFLNDCLPNVPKHLDLLFSKANNILIKTSPLLDITVGLNELKAVKKIFIVAVNNEVKELLWELEKGFSGKIEIHTCNIKKESEQHFKFYLETENHSEDATTSFPLNYVYEPNVAILKSGAFNTIAQQLHLFKLHKHTHLYTSTKVQEFPGRRFKVENILPYNKKTLKKAGFKQANITTRNFPETVSQIRKKHHIKDGGDCYLFFCTDLENNKIVLQTKKLA
ncbi:MAG: THUMP-like domain-containing protein [Oceanihabitans sp.]